MYTQENYQKKENKNPINLDFQAGKVITSNMTRHLRDDARGYMLNKKKYIVLSIAQTLQPCYGKG